MTTEHTIDLASLMADAIEPMGNGHRCGNCNQRLGVTQAEDGSGYMVHDHTGAERCFPDASDPTGALADIVAESAQQLDDSEPVRLTWDEREAADRAHRETLPAIDPKGIYVTVGRWVGRLKDDLCTRCGRDECDTVIVHVGWPTADDHLCKPCIESMGRSGEALATLVEGLENIDSAIVEAEGMDSHTIAGFAEAGLREVLTYRIERITSDGTPNSRGIALAAAMKEHGVNQVHELDAEVLKAILIGGASS